MENGQSQQLQILLRITLTALMEDQVFVLMGIDFIFIQQVLKVDLGKKTFGMQREQIMAGVNPSMPENL